ncbi:MAG TPA: ArsI/CadI family heavy metal resistance metalloenzyme [Pyrinomonadaceae bacterium]|jgi:catechol 2,3-dioxygenase-like lactoylglutathione lyase family enzyme
MENETKKEVAVLKAHVALNVRNVEASIEFYKKMLGLEPSKVRTGYAKFDVQNPPLNLTLNQTAVETTGALSHTGLQVASTDDVLAMRQKWGEAGLFTYDEMQTNCCYALQDKTWVTDPDGNQWEAFVVLQDNLVETAMCCTTAADAGVVKHEATGTEKAETIAVSGCGCASVSTVAISNVAE